MEASPVRTRADSEAVERRSLEILRPFFQHYGAGLELHRAGRIHPQWKEWWDDGFVSKGGEHITMEAKADQWTCGHKTGKATNNLFAEMYANGSDGWILYSRASLLLYHGLPGPNQHFVWFINMPIFQRWVIENADQRDWRQQYQANTIEDDAWGYLVPANDAINRYRGVPSVRVPVDQLLLFPVNLFEELQRVARGER